MNRVALDLGVIQIYWYSIFILIGMAAGMIVILLEAKRKGLNTDAMTDLLFYTIVWAIIGARLYYVLFNFDEYSNNILEIFEIWNGGLAIHGGILFGGLYLLYGVRKRKMKGIKIFDISVPGLLIGQAIGRWGNFFNSEVYGKVVEESFFKIYPAFIKKGMYIDRLYRTPLFLYECIWNLIGFIILIIFRRRKYIKEGQITALYCIWYGVGRLFLEGMRDPAYNLMLGNFKIAQIVSIGMIVFGIYLYIHRFRTTRFEYLYNEEELSKQA